MALVFLLGFSTCKKPTPEVDHPEPWEFFVGDYRVTDTANDSTYTMTISYLAGQWPNGEEKDSLVLSNFANKFELRTPFLTHTSPKILRLWPLEPVYDKEGKRWRLFLNNDDLETTTAENTIENDTMVLYFNLDNDRYYQDDQVPKSFCECKHIAVKQ